MTEWRKQAMFAELVFLDRKRERHSEEVELFE